MSDFDFEFTLTKNHENFEVLVCDTHYEISDNATFAERIFEKLKRSAISTCIRRIAKSDS